MTCDRCLNGRHVGRCMCSCTVCGSRRVVTATRSVRRHMPSHSLSRGQRRIVPAGDRWWKPGAPGPTVHDVAAARFLRGCGYSQRAIADRLGFSRTTIRAYLKDTEPWSAAA